MDSDLEDEEVAEEDEEDSDQMSENSDEEELDEGEEEEEEAEAEQDSVEVEETLDSPLSSEIQQRPSFLEEFQQLITQIHQLIPNQQEPNNNEENILPQYQQQLALTREERKVLLHR